MSYSEDIKKRIGDLDHATIAGFLDRIKFAHGNGFIPHIRPAGFRRGSESEYKRKRSVLAHRISGDGADQASSDKDWLSLAQLWSAWTAATFEDVELTKLAAKAVRPNGQPEADIGAEIGMRLLELATDKKASREDIETFSLFAPVRDSLIDEASEAASPKVELESARQTAKRLDAIDVLLDKLDERLTALTASINSITKANAELTVEVSANSAAFVKATEAAGEITTLRSEITDIAGKLPAIHKSLDEARASAKKADGERDVIVSTSAAIEDLRRDSSERAKQMQDLVDRLSSINVTPVVSPPLEIRQISARAERQSEALSFREGAKLFESDKEEQQIDNLEEIADALRQNLAYSGVTQSCAQEVAREVLAAVLSGQGVTFSGSAALWVAQVCATSLAASDYAVADIPIGFSDGRELANGPPRTCLILNNANVGSIELYAAASKSRIMENQFSRHLLTAVPICFLTLAPPPSGLPSELAFSELGPIIDSDALSWNESPIRRALRRVRMKPPTFQFADGAARDFWEDLIADVPLVTNAGSELWKRIVKNAFAAISIVPKDSAAADKADDASLLTSWVIPHLLARGIQKTAISEALSQGSRFSQFLSKPRIASALK